MDKSLKKYIKMCEKNNCIQSRLNKREEGNCIAIKNEIHTVNAPNFYWLEEFGDGKPCKEWVSHYWEGDNPIYYGNKGVWLPSQSQLQKIYMEEYEGGVDMWQAFCDWLFKAKKNDKYKQWNLIHYQGSGEQLWLAFVMEKRFHKVWDGQNWRNK